MEEVHPPLCSQNVDSLQGGMWDGVEFPVMPVIVNEERSCFWSGGCVLCYRALMV